MSEHRYGRITIQTSREGKILFPGEKYTKGDLIAYYEKIAQHMLPHVKERPLMMHRFPDGIDGKDFYHKDVPDYFPDWMDTVSVKKEGGTVNHVVCNKKATLVYLADQACITPHIWLSRVDRINNPDRLIFDLDPPGDDFEAVRKTAFTMHDILDELGLESFPMTTGSRGLHVIVPLNRTHDFDTVREFAQQVAETLEKQNPEELTIELRKNKRGNKLFIDTARNAYAQTSVAPYSLRARRGAPVATPLEWRELQNTKLTSRSYTLANIFRRLGARNDPWQSMKHRGRSLSKARKKLDV